MKEFCWYVPLMETIIIRGFKNRKAANEFYLWCGFDIDYKYKKNIKHSCDRQGIVHKGSNLILDTFFLGEL